MAQAESDYEETVDLGEVLGAFRKHLGFIIAITLVCTVVAGVIAYFMPDEYTAQTTMYVLSRSDNAQQTSSSTTTQSELSAGQMLSNDVSTLITSERVTSDVATELGLDDLDDYDLNVTDSTDTRVITLSVTGRDAQGATDVANAIVADVSGVATEVMGVQSVNVIDTAKVPDQPSGPNRTRIALVGLLVGLVGSYGISIARELLNRRIKSDEDIERLIDVPVIGHFQELRG